MDSKPLVHTALDDLHPFVQGAYLLCALALVMASFHPVVIGLSFACGLMYSLLVRGFSPTLLTLCRLIPLLILIAVFNPLFSTSGSTALFYVGERPVYVESIACGLFMGMLLVACVLWVSSASCVFGPDKVVETLGGTLPTVALVLSMTMRLVPQLVRRGKDILALQQAANPAAPNGLWGKVALYAQAVTVLMEWSMEESIQRSDSMRARGFGCGVKRTFFRRRSFVVSDAAELAAIVLFAVLAAFLSWVCTSQFSFYPAISPLRLWWGYVPIALFLLFPLILQAICTLRWARR